MPMGGPPVAPQVPEYPQYASRIWKEGIVTSGTPLSYVAPVSPVVFGGIWEQNPNAINDSIQFDNVILETGDYTLLFLAASSIAGANSVTFFVNASGVAIFPLVTTLVEMAEITAVVSISQNNNTIRFLNNNGGFVAGIYWSLTKI